MLFDRTTIIEKTIPQAYLQTASISKQKARKCMELLLLVWTY